MLRDVSMSAVSCSTGFQPVPRCATRHGLKTRATTKEIHTMTWTQTYQPLGSLLMSALIAALPVIVLLGLLASSHVAALAGLAASLLVAILVYRMPWQLAGLASLYGAAYGLFPIGWIVLCAI